MAPPNRKLGIWTGQALDLTGLFVLLGLVVETWLYFGHPTPIAFWVAVTIPIMYQVFVWLTWRLEFRSQATSQTIGFFGYVSLFFVLFEGRFVSLLILAWLDRGSLHLHIIPQVSTTILFGALGLYAIYSVKRYFGMKRAAGADHFDSSYRTLPPVTEGIFRYTRNGMYVYAFLLFWMIAIGLDSSAALVVAAFTHAYIWVHFYATEKPDMDYLYASSQGSTER